MLNIICKEDSENCDTLKGIKMSDKDKRYSTLLKCNVYNFVGFILENNNMLAVFPKHYFKNETEKEINKEENVKLLYKVINRYVEKNHSTILADKYIGNLLGFDSNYPFSSFFQVYDYYKKYGLFREEINEYKNNSNGKVSWKKTMQKSNLIVSNDNLLYIPLYSKVSNYKDNFISECMIFVINYTIKKFPYFISLIPINEKSFSLDFIENKEYVLQQLYKYKNSVFIDKQIKLINNLIKFFEELKNKNFNGGNIHFKILYFDLIWQDMVEKYLNDYFVGVEEDNIKFNYKVKNHENKFKSKKFVIDTSQKKEKEQFNIVPDHYLETKDKIYLFDSKYYVKIKDLNYKQLAYTLLIGNSKDRSSKTLYSALILPGNEGTRIHIELTDEFKQLNKGCNKIIEQYLDVNTLMRNYLDYDINKKVEEDDKDSSYCIKYYEKNYEPFEEKVAEDDEEYIRD